MDVWISFLDSVYLYNEKSKEQKTLHVTEKKNDSQQEPGMEIEQLEDHDSQDVLSGDWEEDAGAMPKYEESQRCQSVFSPGLLSYYAMPRKEE